MDQAAINPNTSSTFKHLRVDPVQEGHYVISETAELQFRYLRDGMKAVASLCRGGEFEAGDPPDVAGQDLGALFDVFALAADAIIATMPFAGARKAAN